MKPPKNLHPCLRTRRINTLSDNYFLSHSHKFKRAFKPGDVLVLAPYNPSEPDRIYPVEVFHVDRIDYSNTQGDITASWKVTSTSATIRGRDDLTHIHDHVMIKSLNPAQLVNKPRGVCTLFQVRVAHGYSLHFLDYVRVKLPALYQQLNIG